MRWSTGNIGNIYVYETWFVRVYTTTHVHTHRMYMREVKKKENARTWHWYIIAHRGSLTYQSCTYIDNVPFTTKKKEDVKRMKFSCDDDLNLLYRFKKTKVLSVLYWSKSDTYTHTYRYYNLCVTTQVYTLFVDLFLFIFIIHTHTLFHIWYMFSFHYNNNHNNNDNQLTILVYL